MNGIGTAIILAGGKSIRMGFDKQFLEIKNKRMIDIIIEKLENIFLEIIIVTNRPEEFDGYPYIIVEDELKGRGPLAGIHVGLKYSSSLYNYVTACDMPSLNIDYIQYMKGLIDQWEKKIDAVITRYGEHIEPFNSFYSKGLIDKIEKSLWNNNLSINTVLNNADVVYIPENKAREFSPDWEMFVNLNSMEDLIKYSK